MIEMKDRFATRDEEIKDILDSNERCLNKILKSRLTQEEWEMVWELIDKRIDMSNK